LGALSFSSKQNKRFEDLRMQQNKNEHEVQCTLCSRSYIALIIQQQIHQWQQTNAQLTVDPSQTRNFSETLSESKTSNYPVQWKQQEQKVFRRIPQSSRFASFKN